MAEDETASASSGETGPAPSDTKGPSASRSAGPASPKGGRRGRRPRPLWLSMAINIFVALVALSLVQAFVVRVHNVSSGSMEDTLGVTDRILSSNLPYINGGPARGDIIIFGHGDTWDSVRKTPSSSPLTVVVRAFGDVTGIGPSNTEYTVKRVIGIGGDTVKCCDTVGRVEVNGNALSESYLFQDLSFTPGSLDCTTTPRSPRCFDAIVVPKDKYLVMGDHRSNSADSVYACRQAGAEPGCAVFVDRARVTGKVIARIWPPGPVG